ncbi:nitronate monooxygenase family protein [Pedobacter aquatilis]|uniref:NAD(P)H-dependent flavin oxidoreductase n=1 Tax=Pedobacter aquatilis TaxID=351343 RepID=UPI00292D2DA6|nr:nitronate monooxygenase family protein [Pedobacter aquatilis]
MMSLKNAFTERLNIKYALIQAPMLGVSTPEMAAIVSNEGGLGSLPVGGLSPEATRQLIQKTKSLTNKPFALNLFTHRIPDYDEHALEPMRNLLMQMAGEKGYQLDAEKLSNFKFYTYRDQLDVIIEEAISIVSFTFGRLDAESIQLLKAHGCTLIGTATCVGEAQLLEKDGVDLIVVQGIEAGGHRGTFIENIPLPQIGLFSLLPQVIKAVKIPCIAAGGINSGETINAAFKLGSCAVQIGTAFIATQEADGIAAYKSKVKAAKDTDTALTRSFSGRWARGIRNEMMERIEQAGIPIPPYPFQNSLTTAFRKLAQQANDADYTNLWAGQSAGVNTGLQTSDVFKDLIRQYETLQH